MQGGYIEYLYSTVVVIAEFHVMFCIYRAVLAVRTFSQAPLTVSTGSLQQFNALFLYSKVDIMFLCMLAMSHFCFHNTIPVL